MKTVSKIKSIEQKITVFVADDGTEFSNRKECLKYESDKAYDAVVKSMKQQPVNCAELTIPSHYDIAYFVNSEEEFDALIVYYSASYRFYSSDIQGYDGPGWYLMSMDYSGDYYMIEITSYNKILNEFNSLISEIDKINNKNI